MDVSQAVAALKQKWREFYESFTQPPCCVHCGSDHVVWNGSRERKLSVLVACHVVFVAALVCRRVRCQACRHSWTLRPPGVSPRRHYHLDVVAQAASQYLFEAGQTEAGVAAAHRCDPRTVSRWLHWVPALAAPELLQRLVMQLAEDLVVPAVRAVEGLARKATSVARCVLLERAARVLCLLEALAMVRGLEPPGLRGVVETAMHVVDALLADERPHLLVLDEAHKMPDDTLEDVRLLTIADFDRQSPFLLLLAGQLALDDRLADPTHHALDQRVTTVARLAPLSPDETTEYLRVRLRAAGVDQPVFEPGAGDAIYDATSGVPRAINNVATAALIVAAARGRRVVTAQDVHDARLDRGRKPQATPQNKR